MARAWQGNSMVEGQVQPAFGHEAPAQGAELTACRAALCLMHGPPSPHKDAAHALHSPAARLARSPNPRQLSGAQGVG